MLNRPVKRCDTCNGATYHVIEQNGHSYGDTIKASVSECTCTPTDKARAQGFSPDGPCKSIIEFSSYSWADIAAIKSAYDYIEIGGELFWRKKDFRVNHQSEEERDLITAIKAIALIAGAACIPAFGIALLVWGLS